MILKRIKILVKNDLLELLRKNSFSIIAFCFCFILTFALWFGYNDYKTSYNTVNTFQEKTWNNWINQDEKHPHSAGHFGTFSIKEVSPFSIIDKGIGKYVGNVIRIQTHNQHAPSFRQIEDLTYLSRQGELSLSLILQIFIPLFIISLTYNSITKEKENNTLKMNLCQGVTPKEILFSKFLSTFIAFCIIIAPFLIITSFLIYFNSNSKEIIFNLVLFMSSYMIYFVIFFFLSIGISARNSTSKKALIWLFSLWIFTIIIIPRITSLLSEQISTMQSAYDFTEEVEKKHFPPTYKSAGIADSIKLKLKKELFEEYNVNNIDSLPLNFFGYFIQYTENEGTKAYNESYKKIDSVYIEQQKVHKLISVFSPLNNLSTISMSLSSSNFKEHINFVNFSEKYRLNMMKILNKDIMLNANSVKGRYTSNKSLWNKIPKYIYPQRRLKEKVNDCKINLIILLIWFILSFLFFRSSTKYVICKN